MLVMDSNQRLSQFALDTGVFMGIFASSALLRNGDSAPRRLSQFSGWYNDICVLGDSSGEVAVADGRNHRIQIFDHEGT